jgi:predicted negative regulator of RcsB-dependent stress response
MLMDAVVSFFSRLGDSMVVYRRELLIAVCAVIVTLAGIAGYRSYRYAAEVSADRAMAEIRKYMNAPVGKPEELPAARALGDVSFATQADKQNKVISLLRAAYTDHRRAGIAPLFGGMLADGLYEQGNVEEALRVLDEVIVAMSDKNMRALYELRRAVVYLESDDEGKREKGASELYRLAEQENTAAQQIALYYAGYYHWSIKQFSEAKNYWSQLTLKYGTKDDERRLSFWVDQAKQRLKLIEAA